MTYRLLLLWLTALALVGPANADIYTWTDARGVRHYSDSARAGQARRADLPGIQIGQGEPGALERAPPPHAPVSADDSGEPESRTPKLVAPRSEAVFRNARGVVPIHVTIGESSNLRAGEQIAYYLDGSSIPPSPTDETRLRLGNVAGGAHTLSAALLYRGRELRRTSAVTFYVKPPPASSSRDTRQAGGRNDNPAATSPRAMRGPAAGEAVGVSSDAS